MKAGALTTAFICMGALILFFAGTAVIGPFITAAALAVFFFISHLFSYPRILIGVLLVYGSFADLVKGYSPSTRPFALSLMLIFAGISFFLVFENVLKHGEAKRNPEEKTIRKIIIYLMLFAGLSIVFHNMAQIKIWARFIYMYMLQVPLLLYCLRHVKTGDFRKLFKYLTFLFVVQLVLNGAWLLHINPLPNIRPLYHDFAYGSLQSCRFVALFSISMFGLYVCLFDNSPSMKWKWRAAILAILCVIQFYFTYTNHMYLTAFILFLLIGVPLMRTMKRKALWIVLSALAVVILSGIFLSNYTSKRAVEGDFEKLFTQENLQRRQELFRTGPKGESYRATFTELHGHSPISWLVGVGPGMYMSVPAFVYVTPLAWKYMGNYYLTVENEQFAAVGGVNVVPMFGMGVLFGELGILGSAAFLAVYLYPVFRIGRRVLRGEYTDRLQSAMARGFIFFVILFLLENFAFDWFDNEFSQILFAVWAATVWVPDDKREVGIAGEPVAVQDEPAELLDPQKAFSDPVVFNMVGHSRR